MSDFRPLSGLRILDLTHWLAGPFATKLLADLGASVVKVERPGSGDPTRRLGPFAGDEAHPEGGGLFNYLNSSKKGITLDLRSSTGRQILLELLPQFDAVADNFRPAFLPELGLDQDRMRAENPDLMHLSITNYGLTGPRRNSSMTEVTAQADSGLMSITGDPDRAPLKIAGAQAQYVAGLHGAVALSGALLARELGGTPTGRIDVSIYESMVAILGETVTDYSYTGRVRRRQGNRQSSTHPFTILPCADGYVGVTVLDNPQWARLLGMIDMPELRDEKFATPTSRRQHADELDAILLRWLSDREGENIFLEAQRHRIPFGKVSQLRELPDDPQYAARGVFADRRLASGREQPMFGSPFIIDGERVQTGSAPSLGEHNQEILRRIGLDEQEVLQLTATAVI